MTRTISFGLIALLATGNAHAQERATWWTVPSTLGYAAIGGSVGYALTWVQYQNDAIVHAPNGLPYPARRIQKMTWGGAAVGGLIGMGLGLQLDRDIAAGRPVSANQRRSIEIASIMTGMAAGTYADYLLLSHVPHGYFNSWGSLPLGAAIIVAGPMFGALISKQALKNAGRTLQNVRVGVAPDGINLELTLRPDALFRAK